MNSHLLNFLHQHLVASLVIDVKTPRWQASRVGLGLRSMSITADDFVEILRIRYIYRAYVGIFG